MAKLGAAFILGGLATTATLLFSAEFAPAVELLQWQTVGNTFKLASWALAFAIVAAARSKTYFLMELSFNIVLLALHVTLALTLLALARTALTASSIASVCLALTTGLFGLRVVLIKMGPKGPVAARFTRLYAAICWPIQSAS